MAQTLAWTRTGHASRDVGMVNNNSMLLKSVYTGCANDFVIVTQKIPLVPRGMRRLRRPLVIADVTPPVG